MPKRWTWRERAQAIRWIVAGCWLTYVAMVLAVIALLLPSSISYYAGMFLSFFVLAVGPPAWINYNWVYNPAYLFGSNAIRRIHFSEQVETQVSLKNNIGNSFGVAALPLDLHTSPATVVGGVGACDGEQITSIQVVWDDYLLVPGTTLLPTSKFPRRTVPAILEFGSGGLVLSAGRWRPGVVLELPYSRIIGVWNGSEIKTIDSGGVLVVVVGSADDELLFPFEVVRVKPKQSPRAAVEALIRVLERRRLQ